MRFCQVCRTPTYRAICGNCSSKMVSEYVSSGHSVAEIARSYGVNSITLWRRLKREGVLEKDARSRGAKRMWSTPDTARRMRQSKPMNQPESVLFNLLVSVVSEKWRYAGDGSHPIGTRQPDFWDGGTKVIELFGERYHQSEDVSKRISFYEDKGFQCLVVWVKELDDFDSLVAKLHLFTKGVGRESQDEQHSHTWTSVKLLYGSTGSQVERYCSQCYQRQVSDLNWKEEDLLAVDK